MDDYIGFSISVAIAGLLVLLVALLIYQSIRKNRKAYILTVSLAIGAIAAIFSFVKYLVETNSNYFLYFGLIIFSIMYYLIYFFFENLSSSKPNRFRLAITTIVLFSSMVFHLLILISPSTSDLGLSGTEKDIYEKFIKTIIWGADVSYNLLGILIFVFGAFIQFKAFKFSREVVIFMQAISMVILSLGFIVGFFGGDVVKADGFLDIGDGIKIVGMLIFATIYIIKIDFIYRLSVNVYFILIFTKIGLNIHISRVHDARHKSENNEQNIKDIINENLLSSLITAISSLLKESLGSSKNLKAIIAEDRTVILDSGQYASCAILCDKSTFFLEKSLNNLLNEVEKKYQLDLMKSAIIKADFKEIEDLINKTFPFLIIEKSSKISSE